jgi:hypothetical protein
MTQEELNIVLEKHKKWLCGEEDGERADLHSADLIGADLHCADLRDANLPYADLRGANLHSANLHSANLRGADLSDTNLRGANLRGADLSDTNLRGANLRGADLSDTNLRGANLRGANLRGANLDYSCWPLWCGSLRDVQIDKRIFAQLAYHLCRVIVDDDECKAAQRALYPIANQFHRVNECGRLPLEGSESHDD